MHDDDAPIGTILSRREALFLLGAAGASLAGGPLARPGIARAAPRHLPMCVVRPEQTEGPYFTDVKLDRRDIRADPDSGNVPEGIPLELAFRVSRVGQGACEPLAGAIVDIWQCDALGIYSDVLDTAGRFDTRGRRFLRGHQVTDPEGAASFTTIFPGWYEGRTVHIHFKIRTAPVAGALEFTSQLYFDDDAADAILRQAPYAGNSGRRVRNRQDGIFRNEGGEQLLLSLTPRGSGFATTFDIGLHMA